MLKRYWQSLKADKETRQLTWVVIAWIVIVAFIDWLSNHWSLLSALLFVLPFLLIAYGSLKLVLKLLVSAIKEILSRCLRRRCWFGVAEGTRIN